MQWTMIIYALLGKYPVQGCLICVAPCLEYRRCVGVEFTAEWEILLFQLQLLRMTSRVKACYHDYWLMQGNTSVKTHSCVDYSSGAELDELTVRVLWLSRPPSTKVGLDRNMRLGEWNRLDAITGRCIQLQ